ncbi:MAG: phosphoribosyl-AMP cyclohydrolase [Pseudomonadota bacterium]
MSSSIQFPAPLPKAEQDATSEFSPKFDADGLITAVAVDADDGQPLMLAYMNAESLALTLQTGEAHYWSRSRAELWHKGATSGNVQEVVEVLTDCDQDALVLRVRPKGHGSACHTGRKSCFYRSVTLEGNKCSLTFSDDTPRFDPNEVYQK